MYDIRPLEEEWKKYKKKRRKPWFIMGFPLILIAVLSFIFLYDQKIDFSKFYDNIKIETVADKSPIVLIDKALTSLDVKKPNATEIKPILTSSSENESMDIIEDMPIPLSNDNIIHEPEIEINTEEEPRKKVHLNIIETSSVSAYKDVAKRFNQSHDTDDSLFLAKSYYRKGNYKNAEFWALQTNKVNGHIEASWLIFAKAKVKLGRKNEAIRVLKEYIKKSNSIEAKKLLYQIQKNTY